MIIIDYLQLMNATGMKFGSREQEVSTISRSLKGLAKELDIPAEEMDRDTTFESLHLDSLDTVEMLMDAFSEASGEAFANDRILLS